MKAEDLKVVVKEKYGEIANQSKVFNETSCCGSTGCCDSVDYTMFAENYEQLDGYNPNADLGLGCGIPTEYAGIETGHSVLDLGSGAGNDCFVARSLVGDTGHVTGLDFTDEMLAKARDNAKNLKFDNVEFIKGDIEEMPLPDNTFDVVVSNCVLNLVPNKVKAFKNIARVLKSEAHFSISDVVLEGELPSDLRNAAEMYAGCVSGAIQKNQYLQIIENEGFERVEVKKNKAIVIPDKILKNYISDEDITAFRQSGTGIYSITVVGYKK